MDKTTMKPTYEIIETVKEDGAGKVYCCYGLRMICEDGYTVSIEDMSLEREKIERLAHLCNELELSPLHLWDVAQDFVNDH